MNLQQTIDLFKSLPQEENQNAVPDAKADVKNHERLGNHILHIIPYAHVPLKRIYLNLVNLKDEITDSPKSIDRIMTAVVAGNIDNAIHTIGLPVKTDLKNRNILGKASRQSMLKHEIDFGFNDSPDPKSWRNREWTENESRGLQKMTLIAYINDLLRTIKTLEQEN